MSETKRVTVKAVDGDFQVRMPNKCIYCGGPAEMTSTVTTSYKRGKRRIRRTWKLPYCNEHFELQKSYRKELSMAWLFIILFLLFSFISVGTVGTFGDKIDAGLGFVLALAVGYVGASLVRGFFRKQKIKKNPELADMLSAFYLGANVSNYGNSATYTFTNAQIADEFTALNPTE